MDNCSMHDMDARTPNLGLRRSAGCSPVAFDGGGGVAAHWLDEFLGFIAQSAAYLSGSKSQAP
jgi:hypothetical protein